MIRKPFDFYYDPDECAVSIDVGEDFWGLCEIERLGLIVECMNILRGVYVEAANDLLDGVALPNHPGVDRMQ